jgi:hypothetical protein
MQLQVPQLRFDHPSNEDLSPGTPDDHPSNEDLSPGTPDRSETWGTRQENATADSSASVGMTERGGSPFYS